MYYWEHAGIALATSVVSWIGVVIYIFLLIKTGKILRPINNQSNKYINYNPRDYINQWANFILK